ncbi:MAG: hypothetical protein Q7K57_60100 [Burkholderiaceae bacterium]|nr:hypothetical protein [Burkholderiaceae bacterium]
MTDQAPSVCNPPLAVILLASRVVKCLSAPRGQIRIGATRHTLIGRVVMALEAEKQLPETVELKVTGTVKNPFA